MRVIKDSRREVERPSKEKEMCLPRLSRGEQLNPFFQIEGMGFFFSELYNNPCAARDLQGLVWLKKQIGQ